MLCKRRVGRKTRAALAQERRDGLTLGLYLLRRLGATFLTVLTVSFVAYLILTYSPGDAAAALLGEGASAEQLAAVRSQLGLDQPLLVRYAAYVAGVARGDLGRSLASGRDVGSLIAERLPQTLLLAGAAISVSFVFGVALGLLAAARRGSRLELLIQGGTALGLALPSYWVALVLVMVFSLWLGWLPVFGAGSLDHLALPTVTLALPGVASSARFVRSSLLEALGAEYLRVALAKGLTPRRALLQHALPNSLVPALTLLGLNLAYLLGGAFVVETIFAWPGIGRLTVQAVFDRDVTVVMGVVLVVAPLCLLANLAVDLLQAALDPRVRQRAL